jgi:NAD(P)H dehydrogenase (quinone)
VLKENIVKAGMPNEAAEMMAGIADSMKVGEFSFTESTLENLLGRKPVDLKEFLQSIYAK